VPSLGGRKNFRGPRFLWMTLFSGKNSYFHGKISDNLFFLVIHQVFWIFSFFYQIFRIFPMFNVVKLTSFYSFHTFPRIRQDYFSKYWGDRCMGHPRLKFFGGRPPSPPRSRPLLPYPGLELFLNLFAVANHFPYDRMQFGAICSVRWYDHYFANDLLFWLLIEMFFWFTTKCLFGQHCLSTCS